VASRQPGLQGALLSEEVPINRQQLAAALYRPVEAWHAFWFISGPPHALAVMRIFFGIYWLVPWLMWMPHVELYFSGEGMYFPKFFPSEQGIHGPISLLAFLTQPVSPAIAWLLYWATALLLVLATLGWMTRTVLTLFLISFVYHYFLYFHMFGTSFHRLLLILNAFLILSPCGKALSIDSWLSNKRGEKPRIVYPLWTQRVICVEIAALYMGIAVHKIMSPYWDDGANIASSFMQEWSTPFAFWLSRRPFLTPGAYDLMTVGIILWEIAMTFALFSKKWRYAAFLTGAIFHLSTGLVYHIWQFTIITMTYVLFLEPEIVKTLWERINQGSRRVYPGLKT
jgi:hypothetical protein